LFLNLAFFNIILIEYFLAVTITIWWNSKLSYTAEKQKAYKIMSMYLCVSPYFSCRQNYVIMYIEIVLNFEFFVAVRIRLSSI